MLGGNSPVMVFNFTSLNIFGYELSNPSIFGYEIPLISIPVYLDEELTGIVVDDHERTINVEYETDGVNNYERQISSDVKISIKAQKDNVAFQAFLSLFEQVLKRTNSSSYKLYFYYDDVFLTDAGLKDFNVSTIQNTDTRLVTFTLTNRSEESLSIQTILKNVGDSLKDFLK